MSISSLEKVYVHHGHRADGSYKGRHQIEIISLLDPSSSEESDDDSMMESKTTKSVNDSIVGSTSSVSMIYSSSPLIPSPSSPLSQEQQISPALNRKRKLSALNPTTCSSSVAVLTTMTTTTPSIGQPEQMLPSANADTTSIEKKDDDKQAKRRQLLSQKILSNRGRCKKRKTQIPSILRKCRYGKGATDDSSASSAGDINTSATATCDDNTSMNEKKSSNAGQPQNKSKCNRKQNFLSSLIISNKKVLFAPPTSLQQICIYQVDPNEYTLTHSVEHRNNDSTSNGDFHHEYMRNIKSNKSIFRRTNIVNTAGQPTGEGENKTNLSEILMDCVEYGSLEEVIACLKNGVSARGSDNIKPINIVKTQIENLKNEKKCLLTEITPSGATLPQSKNNDELMKRIKYQLCDLSQKYHALKIYKEVGVIIDIARNIDNKKKSEKEVRSRRHQCARRIKDVCRWIECFQQETATSPGSNNPPLIDVNITSFHDTTLLHAAVLIYAIDVIEELQCYGAKTTIKSAKLGTVPDLAKELAMKAKRNGDAKIEKRFRYIISQLQARSQDAVEV